MTVKVVIGDMFQSKAQTLVNTVNTVGVMGKGVALEFRKRFPAMYDDYVRRCSAHEVRLGRPYVYKGVAPPWILNFPTKDHWRSLAHLDAIEAGLNFLEANYKDWGITSLAVPPLGAGSGQLEWRAVGPTLFRHLSRLEIPVELYAPFETPHEELRPEYLASAKTQLELGDNAVPDPRIPASWVALVEILRRIESHPYHWPVGRIFFQKVAYTATRYGIPTGLVHRRGSYGPYAAQLKALIAKLLTNGIIQERRKGQRGQMFVVTPGPTFENIKRVYRAELQRWESEIESVADLYLRLDTKQAELVATVDFAAKELEQSLHAKPDELAVLFEVMKWKQRRRPPLAVDDVARTIRNLGVLGRLDVTPSLDLPAHQDDEDDLVSAQP